MSLILYALYLIRSFDRLYLGPLTLASIPDFSLTNKSPAHLILFILIPIVNPH